MNWASWWIGPAERIGPQRDCEWAVLAHMDLPSSFIGLG